MSAKHSTTTKSINRSQLVVLHTPTPTAEGGVGVILADVPEWAASLSGGERIRKFKSPEDIKVRALLKVETLSEAEERDHKRDGRLYGRHGDMWIVKERVGSKLPAWLAENGSSIPALVMQDLQSILNHTSQKGGRKNGAGAGDEGQHLQALRDDRQNTRKHRSHHQAPSHSRGR